MLIATNCIVFLRPKGLSPVELEQLVPRQKEAVQREG
jgi:hypothetical protein